MLLQMIIYWSKTFGTEAKDIFPCLVIQGQTLENFFVFSNAYRDSQSNFIVGGAEGNFECKLHSGNLCLNVHRDYLSKSIVEESEKSLECRNHGRKVEECLH